MLDECIHSGVQASNGLPISKRSVEKKSATSGKYLCQWVPMIPDTTPREASDFGWGDKLLPMWENIPPLLIPPYPNFHPHCLDATSQGVTSRQQAISDLDWIASFLLLHPG